MSESQGNSIGKNLARLIKEKRITQAELAERTEKNGTPVTKRTISRIITGEVRESRYYTLNNLARGLEVNVEDLLGAPIKTTEPQAASEIKATVEKAAETIRVPLKDVITSADLEVCMKAEGIRFVRGFLYGDSRQDHVAQVFQEIIWGREAWQTANLIEDREILKRIFKVMQECEDPSLYKVGFTKMPIIDRNGFFNEVDGKLAIVQACELPFGNEVITIKADDFIQHGTICTLVDN